MLEEEPENPPAPHDRPPAPDDRPTNYKRFLVVIPDGWRNRFLSLLLLLGLIVALQNPGGTEIRVLFWTVPAVPKVALIASSFLCGGAALWLIHRGERAGQESTNESR